MDALYNWDLFNVLGIQVIIKKEHFHSPCFNFFLNSSMKNMYFDTMFSLCYENSHC